MSTTEVALTVHLVMPHARPGDAFLVETCRELRHHFGIGHATLQVEQDGEHCPLAPDNVI